MRNSTKQTRRRTTSRRTPAGHRPARTRATTRTRRHGKSRTLVDHDDIRRWAEERGGKPTRVKGVIRIDFPGYAGEGKLEAIDWDDWFEKFDDSRLSIIVQDRTAGGQLSRFNKLVSREGSPRHGRTRARARARVTARSAAR